MRHPPAGRLWRDGRWPAGPPGPARGRSVDETASLSSPSAAPSSAPARRPSSARFTPRYTQPAMSDLCPVYAPFFGAMVRTNARRVRAVVRGSGR
jgi:hypothetical protein